MLLAVRIVSYGCTWEVWRALKKLELLSATPRATLTLLSYFPNFPRASITRYTHAKHEPILNFTLPYPHIKTMYTKCGLALVGINQVPWVKITLTAYFTPFLNYK